MKMRIDFFLSDDGPDFGLDVDVRDVPAYLEVLKACSLIEYEGDEYALGRIELHADINTITVVGTKE